MKKFFLVFALVLSIFALPVLAADKNADTPLPEMPKPLQELVNQGAQVRYLGRDNGLDGWITVKNGQEQYFYVLPDKSAFIMGLLFNPDGKLITVDQVHRLQQKGDTLLDTLADDSQNFTKAEDEKTDNGFKTPSEQLFSDIEASNWIPLGDQGAPVAYAFIDPQCPHCHEFVNELRKGYLDKGKIQLRIIPVGFDDERRAQAAFLLATPDPVDRFYKHLDGDPDALPAKSDINDQGVQRNLAIMQSWEFSVTPMIVYRGKDKTVKLVRGRPKDLGAFINDLGG